MTVCKDCLDRTINCKADCKKWKKEDFFRYLAKRKRKQDSEVEDFLRGNAHKRKQEWNRSK